MELWTYPADPHTEPWDTRGVVDVSNQVVVDAA
jgi:hypothetical protein